MKPNSTAHTPEPRKTTFSTSAKPRQLPIMTKPPTSEELEVVRSMWTKLCADRADKVVAARDAYAREWQIDDELARIDSGRGVIRIFPVMNAVQLDALGHRLRNDCTPPPWLAKTRSERAEEQALRNAVMHDQFVADQVRGLRRDRVRAQLQALAEKKKLAEAPPPPAAPLRRKPTIGKKD